MQICIGMCKNLKVCAGQRNVKDVAQHLMGLIKVNKNYQRKNKNKKHANNDMKTMYKSRVPPRSAGFNAPSRALVLEQTVFKVSRLKQPDNQHSTESKEKRNMPCKIEQCKN